jgi:hypothetical protein
MRHNSLVTTIVFVLGLSIGYFARNVTATLERKDLAAIKKLDQDDIAGTLTQDPSYLTKLWSDDGINLGFPGPPVVGIKAMGEAYAKFRADYPDFQVLKYAPNIKDVQITDGWAIEIIWLC